MGMMRIAGRSYRMERYGYVEAEDILSLEAVENALEEGQFLEENVNQIPPFYEGRAGFVLPGWGAGGGLYLYVYERRRWRRRMLWRYSAHYGVAVLRPISG